MNNFAFSSGVIKAKDDGHFELYQSVILKNTAMVAPVSEVFSSQLISVINNCTISENTAINANDVRNSILSQGNFTTSNIDYVHDSFIEYVDSHPDLFSHIVINKAIQVTLAQLTLQNHSTVTDQDYLLIALDSTLNIDMLSLVDTNVSENMFTVINTNLVLTNSVISRLVSNSEFVVLSLSS